MKKLVIILLVSTFCVGTVAYSMSELKSRSLQEDRVSGISNVVPSSENSKEFETCEKINELYTSGQLDDMLLASYPKHLNESLVVDFDNDGVDEEIRYFEKNGYADIGHYRGEKKRIFWSYRKIREDHNGSNIIELNDRYLFLMSRGDSGSKDKKINPYEVREISEITVEDMQKKGLSPTASAYKAQPICEHDGKKLTVWSYKGS